jgi:hypothetical protein
MPKLHSVTFSFQASMHHRAFSSFTPATIFFHLPISFTAAFLPGSIAGYLQSLLVPKLQSVILSLDTTCPSSPFTANGPYFHSPTPLQQLFFLG